jgi:Cu(I)/Ag(I) efflux system membrane fusion protein
MLMLRPNFAEISPEDAPRSLEAQVSVIRSVEEENEEERMSKSSVIAVAIIGVLVVALFSAATPAFSSSCSSTCGSKSATKAKAERSHGCSGETEKSVMDEQKSDHGFLASYFEIRHLLASDKVEGLSGLSKNLAADIEKFRETVAENEASTVQLKALKKIEKAASDLKADAKSAKSTEKLKAARKGFRALSREVLAYVQDYGWNGVAYSFYCPMAKDSWLQETDKVGNPYYGSEMFKCGKMTGHVMKGKYMATKNKTKKMGA